MYINKGKRDILIFPKFKNIAKIQKIRNKYDLLAKLVPPHITIVFPFTDDITNDELISKLTNLVKSFSPFKVIFKGLSLSDDNYIFLNCIKGNTEIIQLHDEIYAQILPTHLKKSIKYIPHITLGRANSLDGIELEEEFETIVNEITIELIGENEESILIKNIKLGGVL